MLNWRSNQILFRSKMINIQRILNIGLLHDMLLFFLLENLCLCLCGFEYGINSQVHYESVQSED